MRPSRSINTFPEPFRQGLWLTLPIGTRSAASLLCWARQGIAADAARQGRHRNLPTG
jgi:hypothetical protein